MEMALVARCYQQPGRAAVKSPTDPTVRDGPTPRRNSVSAM